MDDEERLQAKLVLIDMIIALMGSFLVGNYTRDEL
jgi:hypothetical protein